VIEARDQHQHALALGARANLPPHAVAVGDRPNALRKVSTWPPSTKLNRIRAKNRFVLMSSYWFASWMLRRFRQSACDRGTMRAVGA